MKKKKAIRNYIFLSILVLLCFIFAFLSFRIPTTTNIFKGFLNGIGQGIQLNGGVTAIYDVEIADYYDGELEDGVQDAISRIQELYSKPYNEVVVEKYGDSQIRIIVPGTAIYSDYLVGFLEFSNSQVDESNSETFVPNLTGEHVKSAKYMSYAGNPGVYIEFNEEGTRLFKEMTAVFEASGNGTLHVYTDKNYANPIFSVSINETITTGTLFLSGENMPTRAVAELYADKVNSGKLGINMSINGGVEIIKPLLSSYTTIIFSVFILILVLASFILLYKFYKELGWVAILSMLTFVALTIIALPLFEFVQLSIATIFGIALSYAITLLGHIIYFEKSKKEYASGKKFIASFKSGYLKSLQTNIDIFAITTGIAVLGFTLASGTVRSILSVMMIMLPIGALSSMVIIRGMSKWYLEINPSKYKKVNFDKGVKANEN